MCSFACIYTTSLLIFHINRKKHNNTNICLSAAPILRTKNGELFFFFLIAERLKSVGMDKMRPRFLSGAKISWEKPKWVTGAKREVFVSLRYAACDVAKREISTKLRQDVLRF